MKEGPGEGGGGGGGGEQGMFAAIVIALKVVKDNDIV